MKKTLSLVLVVLMALAATSAFAAGKADEKAATTLCTVIRAVDHPYHVTWQKGGVGFATMVGLPHADVNCGGNSQKQNDDIQAMIAKTGGQIVFNVDPNESPDVIAIARACEEAGVYWVSWWNKPEDVKVTDYPHWVSHISYDGVADGYFCAKTLFQSMGGKGKVFLVQGMLANGANIERVAGFRKAVKEFPDIVVASELPGEWNQAKAYELVSNALVASPDVGGVWAANDAMALGVIEALKEKGLGKKVLVTGMDGDEIMLQAILDGYAAATAYYDPGWQGSYGLSLALAAKKGEIKVADLGAAKRQWYATSVQIDAKNVRKSMDDYYKNAPPFADAYGPDLKDIWKRYVRGM